MSAPPAIAVLTRPPTLELGAVEDPRSTSAWRRVRRHWPVVAVIAAFVGSAFVIPTLAPAAVNDDFLYARSVQILLEEHELRVLPVAAMTLVFQVGWGALFGAVFGDSFGVLRSATVIFSLLGGIAMYGLCRELGVTRARSALGTAVYLFNPISFVLSYTFMTDAYLIALVTMAAYCYVRGLRDDRANGSWLTAGSVLTGFAFLVRQPGILVMVGVVTYLVGSGRLGRDRERRRLLARVVLPPLLMVVAYFMWFRFIHGVPEGSNQVGFLEAFPDAGAGGIWELAQRLAVLVVIYVGLFVLPVAAGAAWRLPAMLRGFGARRWAVLGGGSAVVVALMIGDFAPFTGRLPWSPQFFSERGLGPLDLRGGRAEVFSTTDVQVLLAVAAASAALLAVALLRRPEPPPGPARAGAGVVMAIGFWLALGVLAPSLPLRDAAFSYDRYFLPLLPMAVALLLWALRPVRIVMPVAWVAVLIMGAFSVIGTHDHLTYQQAAWELAGDAHAAGVEYAELDAGAAWDGYHLYEYSYDNQVTIDLSGLEGLDLEGPLKLSDNDGEAWWIGFYAPAVTSDYIVASEELYGYDVVRRVEYSSWLRAEPQHMYLLRHPDALPL